MKITESISIEELVSLHRNWGYRIRCIAGTYFHRHGLRNSSFPPEKIIDLDRKLYQKLKWLFLVSPIHLNLPRKSFYEFLLDQDTYELGQFQKKERYCIRKSLKNCTFRKPTLEELLTDGLNINRQTLQRQKKEESLLSDASKWEKHIRSVYDNDKFRITGVFYQDRMVGYLTLYKWEGRYCMLHAYIDRNDSNETHPMPGLIYTAINQLVEDEGRIKLSYGMHKYSGQSSLNNFKRKMLFEPVASSRCYVIHPFLMPVVIMLVWYLLKVRRGRIPRKYWSKEVLRLYAGNRDLRQWIRSEGFAGN